MTFTKIDTRLSRYARLLTLALAVLFIASLAAAAARAEVTEREVRAFEITKQVLLPGTPMDAWNALTGDISGWWDHTFSKDPVSFRIEPFVGGHFIEETGPMGAGVIHGDVIYALPGKKLVLDGPLGFIDYAVQTVHSFSFDDNGDGTTTLSLRLGFVGEYQDGWAEALDVVWDHFLVERLKVYMEAGCTEGSPCMAFQKDE